MEFAACGDLQAKINNHIKNNTNFTELDVWKAMTHISKGL